MNMKTKCRETVSKRQVKYSRKIIIENNRLVALMRCVVRESNSWCSNWAWQAAGINPRFIERTIIIAKHRGFIRRTRDGRWKAEQKGIKWYKRMFHMTDK